VIEAQRASILVPLDHLHINHERISPMKQLAGSDERVSCKAGGVTDFLGENVIGSFLERL
jgi:hypothetical protein